MDNTHSFRINDPNVIAEFFDGEVVAVNLETGKYYSLPGVGSDLWFMLTEGASLDAATSHVQEVYPDDDVQGAVAEFVASLLEHQLLATSQAPGAAVPESRLISNPSGAFVPPTVEMFTDLEDILLLDPIHEVDAAGWPAAPTTERTAGQ